MRSVIHSMYLAKFCTDVLLACEVARATRRRAPCSYLQSRCVSLVSRFYHPWQVLICASGMTLREVNDNRNTHVQFGSRLEGDKKISIKQKCEPITGNLLSVF